MSNCTWEAEKAAALKWAKRKYRRDRAKLLKLFGCEKT